MVREWNIICTLTDLPLQDTQGKPKLYHEQEAKDTALRMAVQMSVQGMADVKYIVRKAV